jgi:hypothetical protein
MTPTKDKSSMPDVIWAWELIQTYDVLCPISYKTTEKKLDSVIEWCQYNIGINDPMYPEWTKGHNSAYQDILTKLKEMRGV